MTEIRRLTEYHLLKMFGGTKSDKKWSTFSHNGVLFAPPYIPHNIPILYNGKSIILPPLAEEYCTLYVKYIDSEYNNNKVFRKNFFKSWKPSIKGLGITSLDLCDFSKIKKHLDNTNEINKNMGKEDKDKKTRMKLKKNIKLL